MSPRVVLRKQVLVRVYSVWVSAARERERRGRRARRVGMCIFGVGMGVDWGVEMGMIGEGEWLIGGVWKCIGLGLR